MADIRQYQTIFEQLISHSEYQLIDLLGCGVSGCAFLTNIKSRPQEKYVIKLLFSSIELGNTIKGLISQMPKIPYSERINVLNQIKETLGSSYRSWINEVILPFYTSGYPITEFCAVIEEYYSKLLPTNNEQLDFLKTYMFRYPTDRDRYLIVLRSPYAGKTIGSIRQRTLPKLLSQNIVTTVQKLHQLYITHSDLTADNIVIDSANNVKLIDFGQVKMFHTTSTATDVQNQDFNYEIGMDYSFLASHTDFKVYVPHYLISDINTKIMQAIIYDEPELFNESLLKLGKSDQTKYMESIGSIEFGPYYGHWTRGRYIIGTNVFNSVRQQLLANK